MGKTTEIATKQHPLSYLFCQNCHEKTSIFIVFSIINPWKPPCIRPTMTMRFHSPCAWRCSEVHSTPVKMMCWDTLGGPMVKIRQDWEKRQTSIHISIIHVSMLLSTKNYQLSSFSGIKHKTVTWDHRTHMGFDKFGYGRAQICRTHPEVVMDLLGCELHLCDTSTELLSQENQVRLVGLFTSFYIL